MRKPTAAAAAAAASAAAAGEMNAGSLGLAINPGNSPLATLQQYFSLDIRRIVYLGNKNYEASRSWMCFGKEGHLVAYIRTQEATRILHAISSRHQTWRKKEKMAGS